MLYLRLFFEFFKAGLFAVGGGLATLPFLYNISDATGWYTHMDLADMVAVSESTPGPMGVNMATYVGFTTGGGPGAVTATLGLITPSVIVIIIVAQFLKRFSENRYVKGVFYGLRPASVGLIAAACFLVGKLALLDVEAYKKTLSLLSLIHWKAVLLAALLYVAMKKIQLHPIFFLAASAVIGVVFHFATGQ
ncbi:chromate transporter [Fusobacterium naviforme]|nr:chromate transporter [Moryella indoligenes]KAB0576486.1 chromate transporter [Fusobacterium naviforme]